MLRPPSFFAPSTLREDRQPPSLIPTSFDSNDKHIPYEANSDLQGQVSTLTSELNQCELRYSIEIRRLNEQITHHLTEIQTLKKLQSEKEIAFSNDKNELEIQNANTIDRLHAENETVTSKVWELENLLSKYERDKQEIERNLSLETEENARLKQSISSILSYPDREHRYKSTITELNTQLEHGCNQIHFLQLRLESLQDIIKLHERNVTQHTNTNFGNVLTAWREKVFELLMQKKLNQTDTNDLTKKFNLESKEFRDKLNMIQNEFELQKLCINDKSAQVDGLLQDITIVTERNTQLSDTISVQQNLVNICRDSCENSFSQLTHFSHQLDNYSDKQVGIISLLQHRITFLTDRVGFLVDYHGHSNSRLRPTREFAVQTNFPESVLTHGDTSNELVLSLTRGTLANEIQLLVRERTILRNKLRENSEISKRELKQVREDSAYEKEEFLKQFEQISLEKRQLSNENETLRDNLDTLQESNEHTEIEIAEFKSLLIETKQQHVQERQDSLKDLQRKHTDSLNELENRLREVHENNSTLQDQLNTAHSNAREEKELALNGMKLENQDMKRRLEEMRLHLQAVEAEKNILSLSVQTMTSSQYVTQPTQIHSSKSVIQSSPQVTEDNNTPIYTPHDEQITFEAASHSSPIHRVPTSELVSMVQELAQLSTQVFSL